MSSPSNSKNLSHVPCKFFKQGICQAGQSCPFSHNLQGSLAADKLPCKYFQKGNCKFGLKCALGHYLNGQRINYKKKYERNEYKYDDQQNNLISQNHEGNSHGNNQNNQFYAVTSTTDLWNEMNNRNYSFSKTQDFNANNGLTTYKSVSDFSIWNDLPSSTSPIDISWKYVDQHRLRLNSTFSPFSSNTANTANSVFTKLPEDAIDDNDDSDEDFDTLQDCVPGSLSEFILSADDGKRRTSRSQSGTLSVRPCFDFKREKEEVFLMD